MGRAGRARSWPLFYRTLSWKQLKTAGDPDQPTSSMVLFLAVPRTSSARCLRALARRLDHRHAGRAAAAAAGMLLVVMLLIFLLGWPFEWPTLVFVFVPLLQPTIMALEFDPLWFAVLIAVNFQTTFLSPPVATAAYYLEGGRAGLDPHRYPLGDAGIHGASVDRPAAGDAVPRDCPVVSPLALREVSGAAPPGDVALSGV